MRSRSRCRGIPVVAVVLALMAGCGVNSTFVYKPAAPAAGGPKLPLKVAVLSFKDGTEDFTDRGSLFNGGQYNFAKAGLAGHMTALTPELWAKSFAEELAVSEIFRSARFLYSPSELADEDFFVEGTLKKAYIAKRVGDVNEFAISLRALARSENRVVWAKEVTRQWKTPNGLEAGCGMNIQCPVDRDHAEYNRVMREIFTEAKEDLLATLASGSGDRAGDGGLPLTVSPAPPAPESTEQTIDRILKEK